MKTKEKTMKEFRVVVQYTVEVECVVYAEDEWDAKQFAENNVSPIDYANDTVGFECNYDNLDSHGNYQKIEIECVSATSFSESDYAEATGNEITLYATEETDWDNTDEVFTSLDDLNEYLEEQNEEDEE